MVNVGDKFSRWTVIGPFELRQTKNSTKKWFVRVLCACGREFDVQEYLLRIGKTKQCRPCQQAVIGRWTASHGGTGTPLWNRWRLIKQRCCDPGNPQWPNYGGRGIYLCTEWLESFATFREWAESSGYSPELELDRRDNDAGYTPENCRWVTPTVNARNKRTNRHLTAFGRTLTLAERLEQPECIVGRATLAYRIKSGWPPEDALATAANLGNKTRMLSCALRNRPRVEQP